MKLAMHVAARVIQITGALALGYSAFFYVQAEGFQAYEKWVFDRGLMIRHLAANAAGESGSLNVYRDARKPPAPKIDSVIGRIDIPSLDLSTMILEGDGERQFRLGAGHVPGTGLPGEAGNVVIAGHRDSFFRPLGRISRNDAIVLTTLAGSFWYVVESVEITGPGNVAVMKASAEPTLTLVTCYPFSFVGSAPERFIVHARKLE